MLDALNIGRVATVVATVTMLFLPIAAQAQSVTSQQSRVPIEIVTSHLPPWSIQGKNGQHGIMMDLVEILGQEAGLIDQQFVTVYPWKRAQVYAGSRENVMILPMMRTPEREKRFAWLQKVDQLNTLFVTANGRSLDLEEAKKVGLVTVRLGTPMEDFLVRHKFTNLLISPSLDSQLTMLKKGRVQAWYVSEPLARYTVGADQDAGLTFGPSITSSPVFIATSKSFPEDIALRYQDAYTRLSAKGDINRLWYRYFGKQPQL